MATVACPRPGTPSTLTAPASAVAAAPAIAIVAIGPSWSSSTEPTRPQKKPPMTAMASGMIARSGMRRVYPRVHRPRTRSGPHEDRLRDEADPVPLVDPADDVLGERDQLPRRSGTPIGERQHVLVGDRDAGARQRE